YAASEYLQRSMVAIVISDPHTRNSAGRGGVVQNEGGGVRAVDQQSARLRVRAAADGERASGEVERANRAVEVVGGDRGARGEIQRAVIPELERAADGERAARVDRERTGAAGCSAAAAEIQAAAIRPLVAIAAEGGRADAKDGGVAEDALAV